MSLGLVSEGWIRNKLLWWLEKWQRKDILWVYEIATLWLPCWDWHGTGYMFSLWRSLIWIALVMYAPVSQDNEGCGMLLPVLWCAYSPVLINKARDCYLLDWGLLSALLPDCFSGAKLQSSLDLGGQSWVGRHARPSLVFSNTSCSVASFLLLLANMPGNVIHKVELLSIFIPFLLNHHFVFLFFFSV